MSSEQHTNVLYIGRDQRFIRSVNQILEFHDSGYNLDEVSTLKEIQANLQKNKYHAFLFDTAILTNNNQYIFDRIMDFAKQIPVVLLVEKNQEGLAIKAMDHGAFDYIVRVDGLYTSIPFTLDRATEQNVSTENITFDFQIEPEVDERTAFFEINESGRFIAFDKNLQNILGLSQNEFYKSYLMDFIAEEDRDKFYLWRSSMKNRQETFTIMTEVIHRQRGILPVELQLSPYSRPEALFSGFRGYLRVIREQKVKKPEHLAADIKPFFYELYQLNHYLRQNLTQLFYMKLAELPKKYFHFNHAALFLFQPVKQRYQKELDIGSGPRGREIDLRSDYFTDEEVEELFPNAEFVRFLHQSVLSDDERGAKTELFHAKRWKEGDAWEIGDRLFVNLRTSEDKCLGFVMLENPDSGRIPAAHIYERAEIYSNYVSSIFESQHRFQNLEMKYKHFRQIFTILETFSIDLPLENLLQEIVWTIKLSLGFNLPILAIFSRATRRLNLRAIALENKNKARVLSRLHFTLEEIAPLLKNKYRISRSYLVSELNSPLNIMKRIYGLPIKSVKDTKLWQYEDILLVPVITRGKRIIGFLILDDPVNKQRPYPELVQILEKIARLVAVTIENKLIYTKLKQEFQRLNLVAKDKEDATRKQSGSKIRQVFRRMNLSQ